MCLTLCVQVMEYMEVGSLTPTSACRLSEKGNIRSRILDGAVTGGCARVYAGVAHQLPISCPSVAHQLLLCMSGHLQRWSGSWKQHAGWGFIASLAPDALGLW